MNISFRHNVMDITSIDAFKNKRSGFHENCKDVCFIRFLGAYEGLAEDILHMEDDLRKSIQTGNEAYKRLAGLPKSISVEEIAFYLECYQEWEDNDKEKFWTKAVQNIKGNRETLAAMLSSACKEVVCFYRRENKQVTSAIEKNFVVKLLFWFDFVMDGLIDNWNEKAIMKVAAFNIRKKQEYLFFYMLTLMGLDILLIQNEGDISEEDDRLGLSKKYVLGNYAGIVLPEPEYQLTEYQTSEYQMPKYQLPKYQMESYKKGKEQERRTGEGKPEERKPVISAASLKRADRSKKPAEIGRQGIRREKSFEELALLAASVVLITVHNQKGEPIGSGSGIMVGQNGYILTNHHVLAQGCFYTIRIENDEQVYETDEVIKYHSVLDLAVLRIDRKLAPIPVYAGKEKLVRGQRVVAIGSPLGLFNSVSDGIISGFRVIDNVDMIQFTAPISNGSSGGAVLNMYGEVIGISTAGIDYGQNLNLAMGYECINAFIKGFI